jgi:hypothetical protein
MGKSPEKSRHGGKNPAVGMGKRPEKFWYGQKNLFMVRKIQHVALFD